MACRCAAPHHRGAQRVHASRQTGGRDTPLAKGRGEAELIELSDDETVAAAVMLPLRPLIAGAFGLKPHR
jgi:hypothetical protein